MAKLTIIGIENYLNSSDDSLFSNMILPEGFDREVLVTTIMERAGEFEVLYADAAFLKSIITNWSKKWYRTFDKWISALSLEYNPIENYDRKEDWNDKKDLNTSNGSTVTPNTTSTTKVSAYDSDKMEDRTVVVDGGSTKNFGTGEEHESNVRSGRIHGNIGVTTSQQMIQSELNLAKFNVYMQIADMFINEFCICVY